jgi:hypothetical protein
MKQKFLLKLDENGAFQLPIDVRAIYGEARPAVKMTICGQTFRTRVAVYGGKYFLGVWKAVREQHGLSYGQRIDVAIEPDEAPRTPPKRSGNYMKKGRAQ